MINARVITAGLIGFVFAIGLGIGGMTDANKVIGFLNVLGDWDPSLAFVMGSALAVYAPAYRYYRKLKGPLLGGVDNVLTKTQLDPKLLIGGALFGAGWGLGGFCPGPGLVSAMTGSASALAFVAAMIIGMLAHKQLTRA